MRKIKNIEIELDTGGKKTFQVKELTINEILEFAQTNTFFQEKEPAAPVEKDQEKVDEVASSGSSFFDEFRGMGKGLSQVMENTCDFTLDDLKILAPSDVKEIWNGFKEVNQDFLDLTIRLGLDKLVDTLVARATSSFSVIAAAL